APQHGTELNLHGRALARQEHPQILGRRPAACVVQIDEVRPFFVPQHVARVAVAMEPDVRDAPGLLEARARLIQYLTHQRLVGWAQVRRYESLLEHECSWLFAKRPHVEHWTVLEGIQ